MVTTRTPFERALHELLAELRSGSQRVLSRHSYPQTIGDRSEHVRSEQSLGWREGCYVQTNTTKVAGDGADVRTDRSSWEMDETTLRDRLFEEPGLRPALGLPEPSLEESLDHAIGRMQEGHVYRSGGAEHRPLHGTEAGEETLRHDEGAFLYERRIVHTPPGGEPKEWRAASDRMDEAALRSRAGSDWMIRVVLGLD